LASLSMMRADTTEFRTSHSPDAQLWYLRTLKNPQLQLGVVAFGGFTSLAGAGALFRVVSEPDPASRVRTALTVHLGFLYLARIELGLSYALHDRLIVYGNPSVGGGAYVAQLPVGLSWQIGKNSALGFEIGARAPLPQNSNPACDWTSADCTTISPYGAGHLTFGF